MSASAPLRAIGISGSPSATSRSRLLVERALDRMATGGVRTHLLDLGDLPAEALFGRTQHEDVAQALAELADSQILVVGTPIYRATYTGLLKVFFDLLPAEALRGTVTLPIATGGGPAHLLMIDHGLRPLIASLNGLTTAAAIYATPADFDGQEPNADLRDQLHAAAAEAIALARAQQTIAAAATA
jgi:FMN reductase